LSSASCSRARSAEGAAAGRHPGRGGLEDGAHVVDVGQQRPAVLQHQADVPGGHGGVGDLHPGAAANAAPHSDGALGLQDAERLAQRRPGDAEFLHQDALGRQLVAFLELTEHDLSAQV